jgi:hypothetical protein
MLMIKGLSEDCTKFAAAFFVFSREEWFWADFMGRKIGAEISV